MKSEFEILLDKVLTEYKLFVDADDHLRKLDAENSLIVALTKLNKAQGILLNNLKSLQNV